MIAWLHGHPIMTCTRSNDAMTLRERLGAFLARDVSSRHTTSGKRVAGKRR